MACVDEKTYLLHRMYLNRGSSLERNPSEPQLPDYYLPNVDTFDTTELEATLLPSRMST